MNSIKSLKNIKGKKVLVRVDFNVPVLNGKVEDDFRIQKALPTIKFLQKKGAKVILITHLGKGGETLLPVEKVLNKYVKAVFVADIVGEKAENAVDAMKNGDVILLENLRNNDGEKNCDKTFAKSLAKFGDIYVNEAFPVSHRADASIVLLPKLLPAYAGLQLENEVKNLSKVSKSVKHPFLFILGGAKFSTKMPLIKKYLKTADNIFVGGALANDFLKAKGYEVGKSLTDNGDFGIKKFINNKKLILPVDAVVTSPQPSPYKGEGEFVNKKASEVKKDEIILDVGSESVKNLAPIIKKAKMILWNGPLGKYEEKECRATKEVLKMVMNSKAQVTIGGGDIVAVLSQMKINTDKRKNLFVSTGGGATLDFLANGTLPGIKALK